MKGAQLWLQPCGTSHQNYDQIPNPMTSIAESLGGHVEIYKLKVICHAIAENYAKPQCVMMCNEHEVTESWKQAIFNKSTCMKVPDPLHLSSSTSGWEMVTGSGNTLCDTAIAWCNDAACLSQSSESAPSSLAQWHEHRQQQHDQSPEESR